MAKRLVMGLAALIAALTTTVAAAAPTATTEISISGQADLITPFNVLVYVTVQGESPTGLGTVDATVQQAQPPLATATGAGSRQVICDGQRHVVAVQVFGGFPVGFNLGNAEAFATATCGTSSDAETQSIRIAKP